jgi:hypothetical protein
MRQINIILSSIKLLYQNKNKNNCLSFFITQSKRHVLKLSNAKVSTKNINCYSYEWSGDHKQLEVNYIFDDYYSHYEKALDMLFNIELTSANQDIAISSHSINLYEILTGKNQHCVKLTCVSTGMKTIGELYFDIVCEESFSNMKVEIQNLDYQPFMKELLLMTESPSEVMESKISFIDMEGIIPIHNNEHEVDEHGKKDIKLKLLKMKTLQNVLSMCLCLDFTFSHHHVGGEAQCLKIVIPIFYNYHPFIDNNEKHHLISWDKSLQFLIIRPSQITTIHRNSNLKGLNGLIKIKNGPLFCQIKNGKMISKTIDLNNMDTIVMNSIQMNYNLIQPNTISWFWNNNNNNNNTQDDDDNAKEEEEEQEETMQSKKFIKACMKINNLISRKTQESSNCSKLFDDLRSYQSSYFNYQHNNDNFISFFDHSIEVDSFLKNIEAIEQEYNVELSKMLLLL